MKNKSALVIPLHPKHFNYGREIIKEKARHADESYDLHFVFTTHSEKDDFFDRETTPVQYLIIEDFCSLEILHKTNSFVSIKKYYALKMLHMQYDYISCIDSEIMFLSGGIPMHNVFQKIAGAKILHYGQNSSVNNIIKESLTLLIDPIYHEELHYLSDGYRRYTWWSNIPCYVSAHIPHFLQWISFDAELLHRYTWFVFDDLVYNYYCMLFHGYTCILYSNNSLEFANSNIVEHVHISFCTNNSMIAWVNHKAYLQNKRYYEENGFKFVFHLDRRLCDMK